jgi:hypothetical protein
MIEAKTAMYPQNNTANQYDKHNNSNSFGYIVVDMGKVSRIVVSHALFTNGDKGADVTTIQSSFSWVHQKDLRPRNFRNCSKTMNVVSVCGAVL